MAEYINRDEAIARFGEESWAAAVLENIPAADVVERKHGKWILYIEEVDGTKFAGHRCSVCNEWNGFASGCNFCQNCGADMGEQT